jgi:alkanesulfonate monooxygenase SsuD/methylene tetrahydromethanopterin reductase-like flavin-dependent oxidoreductase (luciferase family)
MRLLLEHPGANGLDALAALGQAALDAGLDGVLLAATPALPAPLVAAAALAARVPSIRIAAEVEVGEGHPLEVAEEAAVVDVASGGRLILVAVPAPGREDRFGEALDLLRTAFSPAPFLFDGPTWRVPANLPANEHNLERRARLTPSPVQPRLEVWGCGASREAALVRGLGYLAGAGDDPGELGRAWDGAAAVLGPAAIGAARARREPWDGRPAALVARLREGRAAFGQSWAVVGAPAGAALDISRLVRPRVQTDRLPEGLEVHWDATLPG